MSDLIITGISTTALLPYALTFLAGFVIGGAMIAVMTVRKFNS